MCLIIFEENAKIQDQYPLSQNPLQKADDHIQENTVPCYTLEAEKKYSLPNKYCSKYEASYRSLINSEM